MTKEQLTGMWEVFSVAMEDYLYGEERTILSEMLKDEGAKEWDSKVNAIQCWYYGKPIKASWCATGLSYYAYKSGKDVVGKYENVDLMKNHFNYKNLLDCTPNYGGGNYKAKPGDVVFMSLKYDYNDCTHVGVVKTIDHHTGDIEVLSCNCDNAIKTKRYNYLTNRYIVAFGRVD